MTATAVQPQAPQMDIQQVLPQQASTAKPGQSFKDVMQAAQQKNQTTAQQTQKTQNNAAQKNQADQVSKAEQDNETVTAPETEVVQEEVQVQSQVTRTVLSAMLKFSVKVEAKTDKEFLEELLEGCNDPEQRFALMLMMAFLEVNPNYSLNDLTEEMAGGGQFEQTQLSPATAVMVAIQRLMEKDNTIQEFPLLKDAQSLAELAKSDKDSFVELLQTLNPLSASYTKGQSQNGQGDAQTALDMQRQFRMAVEQAKKTFGSGKNKGTTDIEFLQQQVDAGIFLKSSSMFAMKTVSSFYDLEAANFLKQVQDGLMANLSQGPDSEFVLKLKPEGLGELTVKLLETAGKMTLSIAASNVETQRMLEAQLSSLREAMKPYEVEVAPIISGKEDAAARFGGAFGEQFHGNQDQPAQQQGHNHGGIWYDDQEENGEIQSPVFQGSETIDQYI
ncbi:flagellar hook-length control protein FliK [bacterium 1XD42-1]|nr:flagellar hook-length control protein FliK [bacterium 1XD42-8]RKJ67664.1 flagellar hook-length control protein FliK [bacterium 1XD42-1]